MDEDSRYAVFVSYVEIYKKYVYDLLVDQPEEVDDGACLGCAPWRAGAGLPIRPPPACSPPPIPPRLYRRL